MVPDMTARVDEAGGRDGCRDRAKEGTALVDMGSRG